ncbi:MAG: hydroxylamine reductase [Rhodopirellula sp.]|nr:hydroxylamine reductase [Rhodopirellula sp.]
MFCYQCEETAKGTGCEKVGVCGKDGTTAELQDVLTHLAKGVAMYAHRAAELGEREGRVDAFVIEALFTTVTNVDFDPERLLAAIRRGVAIRDEAKSIYERACAKAGRQPEILSGPAVWQPEADSDALVFQGQELSIRVRQGLLGEDIAGLQELILYALKGAAAYVDHAMILGKEDPRLFAVFHAALDFLTQDSPAVDDLLAWALKVGELSVQAMELLDAANTGTYGHPEPTPVRITSVKGKAILVSGHDLKDLEAILKQTEGKGINVYTHGEMLPCHAYPGLKKFPHLVGNYGGAWQDQRQEFDAFPGAIVMTTNCIQKPKESYHDRIFTTGLVAWPGVTHIGADKDFSPAVEAALAAPGFEEDEPEKTILVGFGHQAVLGVADKVIEAVKSGAIRHFFLVGGCDGRKSGRSYYTEFARQVPQDCVILTLACGKFRFNKLEFGSIGGIPRLLDMGQCNDAYSAIKVAGALAEAFGCGVNDLPLSLVLSWYEQKAVTVLLALLHLGVRNIRLGPSLPAFITPKVLDVLVEKFALKPIQTPEEDLVAILG